MKDQSFRNIILFALTIALPVMAEAQGGFLHGTESLVDSDIPVAYYLVETMDGLFVTSHQLPAIRLNTTIRTEFIKHGHTVIPWRDAIRHE